MKKPFKVFSSIAMTSALAVSALTPVAVSAQTNEAVPAKVVEETIFMGEGEQLLKLDVKTYLRALRSDKVLPNKLTLIKGDNDAYYNLSDYLRALRASNNNMEAAFKLLFDTDKEVLDRGEVLQGKIENKEVVADEQPEDRLNETFFYNVA